MHFSKVQLHAILRSKHIVKFLNKCCTIRMFFRSRLYPKDNWRLKLASNEYLIYYIFYGNILSMMPTEISMTNEEIHLSAKKNQVLNILKYANETSTSGINAELMCHMRAMNAEYKEDGCHITWDSLLCWSFTKTGMLAIQPCFNELHGIRYDSAQNVSRWCLKNNSWDAYVNYSLCREVSSIYINGEAEIPSLLYTVGYSLSISTLSIAVFIYIYCKELRNLRNIIHMNLMFSYILAILIWMLSTPFQIHLHTSIPECMVFYSLLHYSQLTNYFWMFVEGLYLYVMVVKTFSSDINLRTCLIIGWGLPLFPVVLWGIANIFIKRGNKENYSNMVLLRGHCPWMIPHLSDWIYQVPAIIILLINVILLITIMWVLVTKLRSSNNTDNQQYRKAAKALVVLVPLLGITYILFILLPDEGSVASMLCYIRVTLISSQGFIVALLYCFLNNDVRKSLRQHFERWNNLRRLPDTNRFNTQWFLSRRESARLHSQQSFCINDVALSETPSTATSNFNNLSSFSRRYEIKLKTNYQQSETRPLTSIPYKNSLGH